MISVIIGQMAMSMLIEHKGWLGSSKAHVNKEKLIAVALMTFSLLLITRKEGITTCNNNSSRISHRWRVA
jgi:uncharacterized membrane protein YdcZ (DUF606 family)